MKDFMFFRYFKHLATQKIEIIEIEAFVVEIKDFPIISIIELMEIRPILILSKNLATPIIQMTKSG